MHILYGLVALLTARSRDAVLDRAIGPASSPRRPPRPPRYGPGRSPARGAANLGVSAPTGGRRRTRLICTRYGGYVWHRQWRGGSVVPRSGHDGRWAPWSYRGA